LIELTGKTPVASGSKRRCFGYPGDPSKIIKVLLPAADPVRLRSQDSSLFRRLLPAWYYDEQLREWRDYRRLKGWVGEEITVHIPKCYGLIETDLGLGLVTKFVRNADRTPGKNLTRFFPDGDKSADSCVEELCEFILKHRLVPSDLRPANVVISNEADNSKRAWFVDGYGSGTLLPISDWRRRLHGKTTKRRVAAFRLDVEERIKKPQLFKFHSEIRDH